MSVSVIIPTYNRARLVCEAIDSALTQSLMPKEIIVVDDGSTDDTERVLKAYGTRIAYHRQSNRGVSAARNVGLSIASGDYVAFLDSDDRWHPFKLALQTALLTKLPEVHLLFSEFDILKEDGTLIPQGSRRWFARPVKFREIYDRRITCGELGLDVPGVSPNVSIYVGHPYRQMLREALALTSTVMLRRSAIATGPRFTEGVSLYEDWEFYARIARRHTVAFVDIETATNRGHQGPERLTRVARLGRVQSYIGLIERVWKADPEFAAAHGRDLREVEARALLALAREGMLARRTNVARAALERWRGLGTWDRAGRAWLYAICAALPAGSAVLRFLLRLRTLVRILVGRGHGNYSVNPAA